MDSSQTPAMEEIRSFDSTDNRARTEELNPTSDGASDGNIGSDLKFHKAVDKKNSKKATNKKDISISVNKPKQILNKKRSKIRRFTPEEDKILLEAINSGEKLNCTKLGKNMNRNPDSVRDRVKKLKLSGGVSASRAHSRFNLQEDLYIIDSAIRSLQRFSKLEDTSLEDAEGLAASLRRARNDVSKRWERILKVWLKSYYTKTLNLNIKVMLANVLADNFADIDSIDWEFVKSFKEFSGYTLASIRYTFFNNIYKQAKRHSKDDETELTLKGIAEDAAVTYSQENAKKIPASTLTRQREIIEYFERKLKELGIKDFL